ncbi:hypothetical protein [Winogradskyella tangerina]|uniref:hypothetical protein n=1 Tax=Winogradskyella tangerina TaxID=2023240 RepID=UPI000DBE2082|nr:hypothetical protein [Winogradskyella tangerina]
MRIYLLSLLAILFWGCSSQKPSNPLTSSINFENYNYKFGRKYAKNRLIYSGKVKSEILDDLQRFVSSISSDFDKNKTLLINFEYDAYHCISANPKYIKNADKLLQNVFNISNRHAVKFDIQHLCAYSKSSPLVDYLSENPNWVLDNGIIENTFFSNSQICSGFVIIEPDGSFLCHFGEDYFSEVNDYFEKE